MFGGAEDDPTGFPGISVPENRGLRRQPLSASPALLQGFCDPPASGESVPPCRAAATPGSPASAPRPTATTAASPRLKLKSYQEMSLIDVDPAPLAGPGRPRGDAPPPAGRRAAPAAGHGRAASGPTGSRGPATGYEPQAGQLDLPQPRRIPTSPGPAAAATSARVILGQGGTTWRMADASPPDAQGWQPIAVDPSIVAAAGGRGQPRLPPLRRHRARSGPARARSSRRAPLPEPLRPQPRVEAAASAPYLTVDLGPEDRTPRRPPRPICRPRPATCRPARRGPRGSPRATTGPAGTVGFFADRRRPRGAPLPDPAGRQRRASGCGCTCATSA